jgi:transcription elongation factor GreB
VSRAFVKEDAAAAPLVRPRAPLPQGVPNYVTPRGLKLLHSERNALVAELAAQAQTEAVGDVVALRARLAELEARIASAVPVDPAEGAPDVVRFGVRVEVRASDGTERAYRIVGVDEADAATGRVAFVAPLARALIGKRVGEVGPLQTPRGEDELQIVAVDFDPDHD